jgi:penicillin V acylase-like amidase (Ntn superfamily)
MLKLICMALLLLTAQVSSACTTFLLKSKDRVVFGRNYDWITGEGVLNTNQRGLYKTSMPVRDQVTISWTSKYGSLTFNQYGKEFPTGGMNEKGLVVELMWLDGTVYPAKDDRAAVDVLQWIQYQLDNAATIEEVIASDKLLRISGNNAPLHYLIADAAGNAATIEFLEGKMVVHSGSDLPLPVLTNNRYDYSLQKTKAGETEGNNSLERFSRACSMLGRFNKTGESVTSPVDHSFNILSEVAQGSFTKWSIVYDITNKQVHFKTEGHSDIKSINFTDIDFSCKASPMSFMLNQDVKGDIKAKLVNYTSSMNEQSLRHAFKESAERINVSEAEIKELISYANNATCK